MDQCDVQENAGACTYISLIMKLEHKGTSHHPVREQEEHQLGWHLLRQE